MATILKEFEVAKKYKVKKNKRIRRRTYFELELVRRESIRQFDKDAFRRRASLQYEAGGSSHDAPRRLRQPFGQLATILERGKEAQKYVETSTLTFRLAAAKIELEKNKGQRKLPFSIVESPWTRPLLRTVAKVAPNVSPPSTYEILEVFLKNEYQEMKKYIVFEGIWNERGVTIMCDGWSGSTRISIINFLVYSSHGTVFHKSVNASNVERKDGDYYFKLMKDVVEEIGPEKVVQVVTNNEAAIKSSGKKLMERFPNLYCIAYSTHCIDLILECIEQIATNFVTLESLVRCRLGLRNILKYEQRAASRFGQATSGPAYEAKKIVLGLERDGRNFWEFAQQIMAIQGPLLKVLRMVDGDEKPIMGFIYEAMARANCDASSSKGNGPTHEGEHSYDFEANYAYGYGYRYGENFMYNGHSSSTFTSDYGYGHGQAHTNSYPYHYPPMYGNFSSSEAEHLYPPPPQPNFNDPVHSLFSFNPSEYYQYQHQQADDQSSQNQGQDPPRHSFWW
ncbi:uncharacterized protein LOC110667923 [Hevea brasiliensis]|uniref:uncharacterized protein LOC110667923 n=1 Tax=Hevea brasiliensis TaxID=3981 RepID=UPI0025F642AE|nr:uncharacterized protein LOC110667923 [Hevea brasiliensis]